MISVWNVLQIEDTKYESYDVIDTLEKMLSEK